MRTHENLFEIEPKKKITYLRNVLDERNQKLDIGEQIQVDKHVERPESEQKGGDDRDRPEGDQQADAWLADCLVLSFVDTEALNERYDADDKRVHGEHHIVVLYRYQTERVRTEVLGTDAGHVAHGHIEDRVEEKAGHIECDKIEIQADHRFTFDVQYDLWIEAYGPGELLGWNREEKRVFSLLIWYSFW